MPKDALKGRCKSNKKGAWRSIGKEGGVEAKHEKTRSTLPERPHSDLLQEHAWK